MFEIFEVDKKLKNSLRMSEVILVETLLGFHFVALILLVQGDRFNSDLFTGIVRNVRASFASKPYRKQFTCNVLIPSILQSRNAFLVGR